MYVRVFSNFIKEKMFIYTSMQSSIMRTARLLTLSGGICLWREGDQILPGWGVCLPHGIMGRQTPVDRMTDTYKDITLPQTSFAGGKKGDL